MQAVEDQVVEEIVEAEDDEVAKTYKLEATINIQF